MLQLIQCVTVAPCCLNLLQDLLHAGLFGGRGCSLVPVVDLLVLQSLSDEVSLVGGRTCPVGNPACRAGGSRERKQQQGACTAICFIQLAYSCRRTLKNFQLRSQAVRQGSDAAMLQAST